jgi:threonine dehydrogenase-like Zn-dependent dehydrogenase
MNKLVITGPNKAEFIKTDIPRINESQILVKTICTAISTGTEIRVYKGISIDKHNKLMFPNMPWNYPVENGYSTVGEIVEIGKNVVGHEIGQRVFTSETHKQYAACNGEDVFNIPKDIPSENAAMLNILQVGHLALRSANPTFGENVIIAGLGVIGLSVLAYCKTFGFNPVGIETIPTRKSIAQNMGIVSVFNPNDPDIQQKVQQRFGGNLPDFAIEAASNWSAIEMCQELVKEDGKIVVVSRHTDKPEYNPVGHPYFGKRQSIISSYGFPENNARWNRFNCMNLTIQLLKDNLLDITPLITDKIQWDQLPHMYDKLSTNPEKTVGVIVNWN